MKVQEREVVLCHPVRTAIGTFNGTQKATLATELGAAACFKLSQIQSIMVSYGSWVSLHTTY